jgi:hypothetical protein
MFISYAVHYGILKIIFQPIAFLSLKKKAKYCIYCHVKWWRDVVQREE